MRALVVVGLAAVGGVLAFKSMSPKSRRRFTAPIGRWIMGHMERMVARLPEGAPPKLVMSILPKLQTQNGEIIVLLREQNELLRKQQHLPNM
jgi:hypothetical protein